MLEVQFYGILQQVMGGPSLRLEGLAEGASVAAALERLRQQHPAVADYLPRVACAQGDVLVRREQALDFNQPLVLLPPVSGG
jgi:molybdopterin synthase sulfur carrier subunit